MRRKLDSILKVNEKFKEECASLGQVDPEMYGVS